ncbi:MAG: hypothetical protein F9K49_00840 [Caedimonadaceae bacterium]|nr:MAG: hypothetical protein F9K49_00840 [Caedimonadaceae bacterium]
MHCWVVSESEKIGTLNQCLGVAELLGLTPIIKKIKIKQPWKTLSPRLWLNPLNALSRNGDTLEKPWPDLIIAGGRGTVAPTAHIRKKSNGKTRVIQILDPKVNTALFDAVIAPVHDNLQGINVVNILGGLHRVTPKIIQDAVEKFKPHFAHLSLPVVSVLIGGSNKYYTFTEAEIDKIINTLRFIAIDQNKSLAITVSRRTPNEYFQRLKEGLKGTQHYLWDNTGDNPYFALLGIAKEILVTCDSVAMISEACSTGKPVYIYEIPSKPQKFSHFHQQLYAKDHARPFQGSIEPYPVKILNESERIKPQLIRFLQNSIEL